MCTKSKTPLCTNGTDAPNLQQGNEGRPGWCGLLPVPGKRVHLWKLQVEPREDVDAAGPLPKKELVGLVVTLADGLRIRC